MHPRPTKSEWGDYAAVWAWCGNLSGNELTRYFSGNIRPQSSQPAEPLWTDPGIQSGISMRELISTLVFHLLGFNWICSLLSFNRTCTALWVPGRLLTEGFSALKKNVFIIIIIKTTTTSAGGEWMVERSPKNPRKRGKQPPLPPHHHHHHYSSETLNAAAVTTTAVNYYYYCCCCCCCCYVQLCLWRSINCLCVYAQEFCQLSFSIRRPTEQRLRRHESSSRLWRATSTNDWTSLSQCKQTCTMASLGTRWAGGRCKVKRKQRWNWKERGQSRY